MQVTVQPQEGRQERQKGTRRGGGWRTGGDAVHKMEGRRRGKWVAAGGSGTKRTKRRTCRYVGALAPHAGVDDGHRAGAVSAENVGSPRVGAGGGGGAVAAAASGLPPSRSGS